MMLNLVDFNDNSWTTLREGPEDPFFVPGQQLFSDGVGEPYLCILRSSDGSAHLFIAPEDPLAEALIKPEVAGLTVKLVHNSQVVGRDRQTYIDVRCQHHSDIHLFTIIVKEIATLILRLRASPSLAVNSTIRLWRRFWRRPATRILEEWEQIGLIAELLFLDKLLDVRVPGALEAWTGPSGERHDFKLTQTAFEVKATTDYQRKHLINGLYQLEAPEGLDLCLVSVLFTKVQAGGISLPEQVMRVSGHLAALAGDEDLFWERVLLTGYSPEHNEQYEQTRYTFSAPQIFPVTDDFPRLTPDQLVSPLSPRISAVQYLLDLEGLPSFDTHASPFIVLLFPEEQTE